MKILVANLGSTSLKYRLFDFSGERERLVHKGGFERVTDYAQAIEDCLGDLKSAGAIEGEGDLAAVGFKTVVADGVTGCVRLNENVVRAMEACNFLAPAHSPPYITGIRQISARMPETPLVGLFETAYYQWIPEPAKRYAVPESWYEGGVRRWGFHGASHKFIAERSAELLHRADIADRTRKLYGQDTHSTIGSPDLRVISCHLGGSSSVTGILNGVAIGNSMGLSPQSGLPHNNRVGDLDAFAVLHMMRSQGLTADDVQSALCNEAGLRGLSGGFNDLRDIQQHADQGNEKAKLALDFLVHETRRWIGSYHLMLNGIDAVVFTAGIGENRATIRDAVCANLDQLGIKIDTSANHQILGQEGEINTIDSPVKVLVIPTNEELIVAREVQRFLLRN